MPELNEKLRQIGLDSNRQMQEAAQDIRSHLDKGQPEDFNTKFGNALSYIALAGNRLTDEVAMDLIAPFIGDVATMRKLHLLLSDISPKTEHGLDQACEKLMSYERATKALESFGRGAGKAIDEDSAYGSFDYPWTRGGLLEEAEKVDNIVAAF